MLPLLLGAGVLLYIANLIGTPKKIYRKKRVKFPASKHVGGEKSLLVFRWKIDDPVIF